MAKITPDMPEHELHTLYLRIRIMIHNLPSQESSWHAPVNGLLNYHFPVTELFFVKLQGRLRNLSNDAYPLPDDQYANWEGQPRTPDDQLSINIVNEGDFDDILLGLDSPEVNASPDASFNSLREKVERGVKGILIPDVMVTTYTASPTGDYLGIVGEFKAHEVTDADKTQIKVYMRRLVQHNSQVEGFLLAGGQVNTYYITAKDDVKARPGKFPLDDDRMVKFLERVKVKMVAARTLREAR